MWNSRLRLVGALAPLGLSCMAAAADARDVVCSEFGLVEWEIWSAAVEELNPGIASVELAGADRDRMLVAIPCETHGRLCPPDRVFAYHCSGNDMVLIAYEARGCASYAGEIGVERFRRIVEMSVPCSATRSAGPLTVPGGN